jgi:hypothetical protein
VDDDGPHREPVHAQPIKAHEPLMVGRAHPDAPVGEVDQLADALVLIRVGFGVLLLLKVVAHLFERGPIGGPDAPGPAVENGYAHGCSSLRAARSLARMGRPCS